MPFPFLGHVLTEYKFTHWDLLRGLLTKYGIGIGVLYGLRTWCAGGKNYDLRQMASRVVVVTVDSCVNADSREEHQALELPPLKSSLYKERRLSSWSDHTRIPGQ
jgi:hypothetical protein